MSGAVTKLLVANRGEIARRIFRTCRAMGIGTVAVHSDPDASTPFVAEADEAVPLAGAAPADTYLRADLLVEAARRTGADAVHPGYGFLAEDAGFAQACVDAGLTFVGPPPAAIEAMGSKLRAKALMAAAGVPVLESREVAPGDPADALAGAADAVGWPVLVKASAGGGGRGMRVVQRGDDLAEAVAGASREAAGAFGDGTVFLERWVEGPRHVEVQVIADRHGAVRSLFERECSIQRRHQKVVEEAPSPAVDEDLRRRMGEAAVAAAEAVAYEGVGTVELLLLPDGTFAFLEMNTRLQVEHPVTEAVTGLDLVRLQLLVAAGEPLPAEVLDARIVGHAIEARLYAEDPVRGWAPTTGTLTRFRLPAGVRVDSGVEDGTVVGPHYDPMLAKVVAAAPTRAEAARRLAAALAGARVHGLTTNRDLLVGVLRSPAFLAGETDTGFLDRHPPAVLAPPPSPDVLRLSATAAALALGAARRREARTLATLPAGWRNNPSGPQVTPVDGPDGPIEVAYRTTREGTTVSVDGDELEGVRVWSASPELVDLEVAGVRRRFEVARSGARCHVDSALGAVTLGVLDRLPEPAPDVAAGSLLAPLPGTVVRVAGAVGDDVAAGEVLVVLEAMKMEHAVAAPGPGRLAEVRVGPGQVVDQGTVLAVVDAAPP